MRTRTLSAVGLAGVGLGTTLSGVGTVLAVGLGPLTAVPLVVGPAFLALAAREYRSDEYESPSEFVERAYQFGGFFLVFLGIVGVAAGGLTLAMAL